VSAVGGSKAAKFAEHPAPPRKLPIKVHDQYRSDPVGARAEGRDSAAGQSADCGAYSAERKEAQQARGFTEVH
ncbi:hypothetical protein DBT53_005960, partial [Aerococcus mictus]|uniref:hypothetical protein n=1 Tax=Aerococcus mictus TaxID=2976810 RepID=UPI002FD0E9A2